jgi:hypothetical protein
MTMEDTHIHIIKRSQLQERPISGVIIGEIRQIQESSAELPSHAAAAKMLPTVNHCHRGSRRLGAKR